MLYSLSDVFFSFDNFEFESGRLEYTSEPTEMSLISTIERGFPVTSLRDPRTVIHIFSLEVELGSEDYRKLTALSYSQFYTDEPIFRKIKRLVFNDSLSFKLISNNALFKEVSNRNYVSSSEKVTFTIHATNAEITIKEN